MKMPVMFIGHGSPLNAIENNKITQVWSALGKQYHPKAILVISAHWETEKTYVQSDEKPRKINDMSGFPKALYDLKYPVRGSMALTKRLQSLLDIDVDDSWGIDHGTWSVLTHMYPDADIPVVQLSLNKTLTPKEHYNIGIKLSPLREEGVLIIGSGNIVHSFKDISWEMTTGHTWAINFDQLIKEAILTGDLETVIAYQKYPEGLKAAPSTEHFDPLFYALGASGQEDSIKVYNETYLFGSFSMTSYVFG